MATEPQCNADFDFSRLLVLENELKWLVEGLPKLALYMFMITIFPMFLHLKKFHFQAREIVQR